MVSSLQQAVVRSATTEDVQRLANLIHFEPHVHRHLDWRPPLDWISYPPYLVAESDGEIVSVLACPPDPPNVAWIRLFAVASRYSLQVAWDNLWPKALEILKTYNGPVMAAAIPLQSWLRRLLESSEFKLTHKVVILEWRPGARLKPRNIYPIIIRPMSLDDLGEVEKIDTEAFGLVWQNSRSGLELAYRQSAIATVAEEDGNLIGYQISTATTMGGHLARLAVNPENQGKGVGHALLGDMLYQFERRGALNVTVNTQNDNLISLSLYQKAGFKRTGEEYPVFQYSI